MKLFFFTLTTFISALALAEVKLVHSNSTILMIRITGDDVSTMYKVFGEKSYLRVRNESDTSNIREIKCTRLECEITLEGEAKTNKDTATWYTKAYNQKLSSLRNDQVLVHGLLMKEGLLADQEVDGVVMRRIVEAAQEGVKQASYQMVPRHSKKLKPDETTTLLMTSELRLKEVSIKCYSSVATGWSNRNLIMESCNLEAVASN